MGIEDDDIARVREASDIVAVVSEYTTLKRVGRRWMALCPFHSEKSASFSVNQEEGLYYCHGCHVSGDVITFVREKEHLDFVGAVEKLAARAGVTLRYTDRQEGEKRKQRQALTDALVAAVEWYHQRLMSAADAAAARKYLRSRGITGEEVRQYRLGWAPDAWDELARGVGVPAEVFIEAGLGFRNRRGRLTDAFRGRVLFPIFDVAGNPVAFGGRILPGADGPKYKNSAESSVYAKSKTLYGLNWAKGAIVQADEAIVCEGYTDVLGFAAAGAPRAVATCGTALTEEHVRVLTGYAHRIVLAFDADAAGQNAAARFYEWERQYSVDVAVAVLPAGVDPAELARRDGEALLASVAGAQPFLGFRVARILDGATLTTPEGRARAAEAALAMIAEHPNSLVRDQYVMEVAGRTRIDPERLRTDLASPRPSAGATAPGRRGTATEPRTSERPADDDPGPGGAWSRSRGRAVAVDGASSRGNSRAAGGTRSDGPEREALRLMVLRRAEIEPWLDDALFDDERNLAAYRALRASPTVRDAIEAVDPGAADLLRRLAADDTDAEPGNVVDHLVLSAGQRALQELIAGARSAQAPEDISTPASHITWLKQHLELLHDDGAKEEARAQLLAWLLQESEERE